MLEPLFYFLALWVGDFCCVARDCLLVPVAQAGPRIELVRDAPNRRMALMDWRGLVGVILGMLAKAAGVSVSPALSGNQERGPIGGMQAARIGVGIVQYRKHRPAQRLGTADARVVCHRRDQTRGQPCRGI